MERIIKIGEGILLGTFILLLFLLSFESRLHIPDWLMVAGRMHPLFLHFPIVLLLLALITPWLPITEKSEKQFTLLRLIASLSATITAIMGLLLSLENVNGGDVLQLHKWGGIAIATFAILFYYFYAKLISNQTGKWVFSVTAVVCITITGHFGATITHGNNYLIAPIQNRFIKKVPIEQAVIFMDIIKPIFDTKCANCHGGGNTKGGLSLEDSLGILKGGKSGSLLSSTDSTISVLLKRIHLPEGDKKHMPPISKSQLTIEEMALLTAWVHSGAPFNHKLISLPEKDSLRLLASSWLQPAQQSDNQKNYAFSAASDKKIKELNNNYRVLEPQGINSPALAVSFYGKAVYSKKSLEDLLTVKEQIVYLSLSRMPVKDDEMGIVNQMKNLEKLNINYTDITEKGVEQLAGLQKLQEISLAGIPITNKSIEKLATLTQLSSLFIWNTKIDSNQIKDLRNRYKKIHFETGFVDDGKIFVALSSPLIQTSGGVFDNSIYLKMKHPFKGVELRYSIDGSIPDSAFSKIYKDSIKIDSNTKVIVRAFKKGWKGSLPSQAVYLKRTYRPDSIELATPPDPKYKALPAILADGELSDQNFGNGQWLGYMNNEASIYMYFNNKIQLHSVLINVLKRTEQYVFLPTQLEIWGGMSKTTLKLLGRMNPPLPSKNEPGQMVQETFAFSPASVKCIKIVAKPIKSLPKWHAGKGKKGWTFLNEVVLN